MKTKKSTTHILLTVPFEQSLIEDIKGQAANLHVTVHPAQRSEDVPLDVWAQTEVLYTDTILPDPAHVPNLRWVQFHRPEIGFIQETSLFNKLDLIFTTLSGAGVSTAAEYVIMMMLAVGHRLPLMINHQNNAKWPDDHEEKITPRKELYGSTIGIVGYGSVGREIARQLQSYRGKILAIKRDVMNPRDNGYCVPGLGDPGGDLFLRLYPPQALISMIKECDFIVCCLPSTNETKNLFTEEVFQSMKQDAYFFHIGGRKVVNEPALIAGLQNRLRGAVIDTFSSEPLPPNSPFWRMTNAIITPHLAGLSPYYNHRAARLFIENLKSYISGTPLLNLFDRQLGY